MDLKKMSLDELEAQAAELQQQAMNLKALRVAVARVLDEKRKALELEADIEKLRQKHGVQLIAPKGIASGEAVGTPGR